MLVVCLIAFSTFALAADSEADKILENVQETYEKLDDVCSDFTQTFYWKLTDDSQVVSGHICAKGGDKFKIETPEQLIITDGDVLWTMNKVNKQVIIDYAENASNNNPFIKNFMQKYITEYDAKMGESDDRGQSYILLTSKTGEHFVPRIQLWIDNKSNLITKIVQDDLNENTTTFEMSNLNTDVSLAAKEFKFQPPSDAEVIDMR
jgi:chaperone LolA